MALMCLSPLSAKYLARASFPHVLESSCMPPVPKPILDSGVLQSFWLLATIPILALGDLRKRSGTTLNPSLLQFAARMQKNREATSTRFDPMRWRGNYHQQLVSTGSWRAWWWQWILSAVRWSSYRDRSWRRVCSSRLVALSHDCQTKSFLLQGWSRSCCSRIWTWSETLAKW